MLRYSSIAAPLYTTPNPREFCFRWLSVHSAAPRANTTVPARLRNHTVGLGGRSGGGGGGGEGGSRGKCPRNTTPLDTYGMETVAAWRDERTPGSGNEMNEWMGGECLSASTARLLQGRCEIEPRGPNHASHHAHRATGRQLRVTRQRRPARHSAGYKVVSQGDLIVD
jgi:hypothetical protein